MEYEVAVTPSTSAHEMVRDVVVEEMTDTLSPSGEEKKSRRKFLRSNTKLCMPHTIDLCSH